MVNSTPLEISRDVKIGTIRAPTEAHYIAVRSESKDAIPYIPWTVLEVIQDNGANNDGEAHKGSTLTLNPNEFSLKYLKPGSRLLWRPVEPPQLTKVVLTAPPKVYKALEQTRSSLRESLPRFLKANTFLENLGCYVQACEPVDQGLLPTGGDVDQLSVSVFESEEPHTDSNQDEIDVESFLESGPTSLHLRVCPLKRPVPTSSIMPAPAEHADPESFAFVKMSQLARLGVFSGDFVHLRTSQGQRRLVCLYSYPELNNVVDNGLYVSPLLAHSLGSPDTIEVVPASIEGQPYETAKEVALYRVASPSSTESAKQSAFMSGLRDYIKRVRVVKNKDLIPAPINSLFAPLLGHEPKRTTDVKRNSDGRRDTDLFITEAPKKYDTVIWFQVGGLPTDDEYIIFPSPAMALQSEMVQALAPPAKLNWQGYWGVPRSFDYLSDPRLFAYAHFLHKLLRASVTERGSVLKPTILLKSSKRGAGKSTVLESVCAEIGIHTMMLDAHDLVGDSDVKTLALLRARLDRASLASPCLVCIKHLDALAKKNDLDGKDTPLINGLVDTLDDIANKSGARSASSENNLIVVATVEDADVVADSVRNKFKFEVDVTVPTERERRAILTHLTSADGGFNEFNHLTPKIGREVLTGFELRGDVSIDSLALQTAGLAPPDLLAIVRNAKQAAVAQLDENSIMCSGGCVKITPEVFERAVADARGKFSDSIGAPKIPNVGWKDVGGLDMVKGEILDTIEMPLKHPELFASGLKKRSGILFYGPPGTGKTLLAKAIATNFSLNFFSVKGPELLNMYIGESEANVRRVFQKARDAKPCVVFFDELDSVAPKRGNKGDSGGVMDRIVSQLLAELDGMSEGSDGVFVVGATNRPDLLDEALLRPGRFDKMLYLGVSDTHEKQRTILEALTRKFELDPKVNLEQVAETCPFTYTGADFYAMSSDAMLNAMTRTAGEIDAKIAQHNAANPAKQVSIRRWFESIATPDDIKVLVSSEDFAKAQRELVPSVSADELQHYLRVRQTFEGSA